MIKKIVKKIFGKKQKVCLTQGEHSLKITGGTLEYYVHSDIKTGAVVPVFFHAAIDRKKIVLPRYEGLGLCKKHMWSGISFADPVLPMSVSCSLAWFVGNDRYYMLQRELHEFLDKLSKKYHLTFVFHGGSGGGYAALVQKSFFNNRHLAIVQNPQTNIFDLSRQHTINYFNTYENVPTEAEYVDVLDKYKFIYKVSSEQLTDILYFQNQSDELHVNKHFKPFLGSDYVLKNGCLVQEEKNNYYFVGNWGEGHAILPTDILEKVLQFAIEQRSFKGVSNYLCSLEQLRLLNEEQCEEILK